jgi:hypothetical protein
MKPPTASMAKRQFKKYEFLLKLSDEKAQNFILNNCSELDFKALLEAAIYGAEQIGLLAELDQVMQNCTWYNELNDIADLKQYMFSGECGRISEDYAEALLKYPKEFQTFSELMKSEVSFKEIFFTRIYPKALLDTNALEFIGVDKERLLCVADLRFENTDAGYKATFKEYENTKITNEQSVPIEVLRKLRKRQFELEFILCFLFSITNAEEQQALFERKQAS